MVERLRLEGVDYFYEDKYQALRNVSVSLYPGERVALLGNNGAGKSTFFLCCNGVLRPQNGKIFLNGQLVGQEKKQVADLRQAVGLVFQDPDSQIIAGTVSDEVSFGPMNLRLGRNEVERRVEASLFQMNLDGYQKRAPHYLSGGEKKRVSIADILAMEPSVILLDEPTASLDPENVAMLEETLNMLTKSGITLVVATHDVDFAYRFADRALVFSKGEVVADDGIEKVFANRQILNKAGLKKPLLYELTEHISTYFPHTATAKMPRTVEDMQNYLSSCAEDYTGRHPIGSCIMER